MTGRVKKLGCLVVAALAGLALAEGALRVAGIGAESPGAAWYAGGNHPRNLFTPDAAAGYRLRAGFAGREVARSGEFDLAVVIDRLGLRADPHGGDRRGGILALGDSLTFGEGVEVPDSWPYQLEDRLRVPVVNAGVPGYSTPQMVAHLGEQLERFSPRIVLVTFSPSWDLARCADPFVYRDGFIVAASYAPRLHLVGDNLYEERFVDTSLGPLLGPLSARLAARSRLARLALGAAPSPARRARTARPSNASCLSALDTARVETTRRAAAFLVVFADSLSQGFRADARKAAALLATRGIEVLRLDRLLPGDTGELHYPVDRHWNAAGNRAVATALAPELARRLATAGGDTAGDGRGST